MTHTDNQRHSNAGLGGGESMQISAGPSQSTADRGKARRACDGCRARRLKCIYDLENTACERCTRSGVLCEASKPPPTDTRPRNKRVRQKPEIRQGGHFESPPADSLQAREKIITGAEGDAGSTQGPEPRYLGSTSLSSLAAAFPLVRRTTTDNLAGLDRHHSHHRVDLPESGEHVVLISWDDSIGDRTDGDSRSGLDLKTEGELAGSVASHSILLSLMQSYGTNFLPLYPVLSLAELCSLESSLALAFPSLKAHPPPTPISNSLGKLIVCSIAALSRAVPRAISESLLVTLGARLDGPEGIHLTQTSSLGNIQLQLLLGVSAELHSRSTCKGGSRSWLMIGSAIRMAMDMGLHRNLQCWNIPDHQLLRRRRVWAAAITADRWYALSFGQPMVINFLDCDALEPCVFADHHSEDGDEADRPFEMHVQVTKLSILVGRAIRNAYSPSALAMSSDSIIEQLHQDICLWKEDLPRILRMDLELRNSPAGLLHLSYACLEVVFLLSFLRPRKPIPSAITYRPDQSAWSNAILRTREAIRWCATDGAFALDTWFIGFYSLTWCFFAQAYQYNTTRDPIALESMQAAEVCFQAWGDRARGGPDWDDSLRAKVIRLISFLTESASTAHVDESFAEGSTSSRLSQNVNNLVDPPFNPFWFLTDPTLGDNGSSSTEGVFTDQSIYAGMGGFDSEAGGFQGSLEQLWFEEQPLGMW